MRTSDPDFSPGTLNPYLVKPVEVKDRDRYGYKIIAVISGPFWCAYRGGTNWDDYKVAVEGDAISEDVAKALFPSLAHLEYSE